MTEDLSGARVLVTGGRGFIGAALVRRLQSMGTEVISLGRSVAENQGETAVICDLVEHSQVQQVLADIKPDIVFHLASHVVGARDPGLVLSTFHNNATATVNLLSCALDQGCERVVLTGSLEEPQGDSTGAIPSSPYAAAKLAATAYGRMYAELFNLVVVNLRLFMVYGPGQLDERKLVPYVIKALLNGRVPDLGTGVRLVDWVYIEDVVDAYVRAAAIDCADAPIDIGSGVLTSVGGVVQEIFRLMGASAPPALGTQPDRAMEQERRADLAATKARLGWTPQWSLERGLQATIDHYQERPH